MPDMAEKLGVGTEVRELKIGQSFLNQRKGNTHSKSGSSRNGSSNAPRNGDHNSTDESYHTIRYDFKPASSNTSSTGFLDVDEDNRVSVKIPHEGGGQTNFRYTVKSIVFGMIIIRSYCPQFNKVNSA